MKPIKLYLVGGTVRDHLLGETAGKDYDFAVEAPSYEEMREYLTDECVSFWQERPEFVTLRGRIPAHVWPSFGGLLAPNQAAADFTLCRAEGMYHDNRHPSTVTPTSLHVDLSRRDFTINAIAVDEDGTYIDPFDGIEDAKYRVLRTVGDARARFVEDPLRILRAVRFAVKYHLFIHTHLCDALEDHRITDLIRLLPLDRVREELNRALAADWRETCLMLFVRFPHLGASLAGYAPSLWLKATTEEK